MHAVESSKAEPTDTPLAVGDVVVLKSGSPRMTIQAIDGDTARCRWFPRFELVSCRLSRHPSRINRDDHPGDCDQFGTVQETFPIVALKRLSRC